MKAIHLFAAIGLSLFALAAFAASQPSILAQPVRTLYQRLMTGSVEGTESQVHAGRQVGGITVGVSGIAPLYLKVYNNTELPTEQDL